MAPHDTAQMSVFYGLTGLHGAHVFIGLTCWRSSTSAPSAATTRPRSTAASRCPGIYWHFVDVMWVVVYTTVYLL